MDIHVDPIDLQTVYNDGVVEDTEFWQKRGQPPGYPTPLHPLVQVKAPGGAGVPYSNAAPALIHATVPTNIQIYETTIMYTNIHCTLYIFSHKVTVDTVIHSPFVH